jgi:prepilin-type N-terminal cleavage/methylation domain-containing protein
MKTNGFTLVELIISISLVLIVAVSGTLYLNSFNEKQKLQKGVTEIQSMVKQAQNFAKVKQPPFGSSDNVKFVQLYKSAAGNIEAKVNDVGATYFSNKIPDVEITFDIDQPVLYFWGGTGDLSEDNNGTFFGPTKTAEIKIVLNKGISVSEVVVINSFGGIL